MSLDEWTERTFKTALANDEPRWDALVRSLGLTPLTAEQRHLIRSSGVPKLKGVLPVELRVVLEAIRTREGAEPAYVERQLVRFIGAAQPPKAVMGNIFANAQRSAVRMSSADSISALTCGCCGAARPAGSDLRTCTFCGGAL